VYRKDRIRAAQTAAKPARRRSRPRARAREFAELQASPFFQLWRDAPRRVISMLKRALRVGSLA